jgi:hypothetical protein
MIGKYREDFVRTVTEKLMTYALGRGVEHYDNPTVRAIARQAAADNYRMSSLIMSIVKSTPFTMRLAGEPLRTAPSDRKVARHRSWGWGPTTNGILRRASES